MIAEGWPCVDGTTSVVTSDERRLWRPATSTVWRRLLARYDGAEPWTMPLCVWSSDHLNYIMRMVPFGILVVLANCPSVFPFECCVFGVRTIGLLLRRNRRFRVLVGDIVSSWHRQMIWRFTQLGYSLVVSKLLPSANEVARRYFECDMIFQNVIDGFELNFAE